MTKTDELARRIIERALSATDTTPTLTIGGKARFTLAQLEAMTTDERVSTFGQWAAEYASRFIDACYSQAPYPVLYDPDDGEPVAIQAAIPGKTIIHVVYTRANSTDAS